ncbi:MAG: hypothetical protein ACFFBP_11150 [Promethearchaeota archaeon]
MAKLGTGKSSLLSVNISKGLLFLFFSIYLVIFGVIISGFINTFLYDNPGLIPVNVLSYIPFVCYIGALFLGLMFIFFLRNVTVQKSRETRSRKAKTGSLYRRALFLIIFIFAFVPLLSTAIDSGENDHYFSIYNPDWNGGSDFKAAIEEQGYEVMSVQSSLSAINRLDKSVCLVLFGTNQFYDPIFEIPFFIDFLGNEDHKNSLLICHDHGSTYLLLYEILLASFRNILSDPNPEIFPLAIFADGLLRDNASCLDNGAGLVDPTYPIVQITESHPTTTGIYEVILSQATAAVGGKFLYEALGWDVIGETTPFYSWVDKNGDKQFKTLPNSTVPADDYIDLSYLGPVLGALFGGEFDTSFLERFPLGGGGFDPVVFLAKELSNNRIFLTSDASMFANHLMRETDYDNKQFGINIINWLTYNGIDNPNDWIIVFDEAHIRPEYSRDLSSAGIFGFIMQYIIHLSTNPITAWIYPLWAFYTLRKYLPKKDKDEEKKKIEEAEEKEEQEKFRTSSFFAQKIEWYKEKNRYEKALTLLFRRMERKLNAQLGGMKITTKNVIDLVVAKESGGKVNRQKIRRLTKLMDRMLVIKAGKSRVKSPQEFENLFLEMSWAMKNI